MSTNKVEADQHAEELEDERVLLAFLISNLKLDVDKNKKTHKQLKKANMSHTQELEQNKCALEIVNLSLRGVIVSRPQLRSTQMKDKVMQNNSTMGFENYQFALSLRYEDLVQGNVTIKRVYYVEDLKGNDLLTGTRRYDLYTTALQESSLPTPIWFMAKASPTQAWLWHRRACGMEVRLTMVIVSIVPIVDGDDDEYDYDKESIISTNSDILETPSSDAITTSPFVLPIEDPEDSLIMGNEELNTIPEKESDEFIKSSVEDLVPIPSESEDTSGSDSVCILPSCNDFSPIDIPDEKAVTFFTPLFNSNDDFTFSDDESLSDEDVPEDNVKIYSNPLFEFDDEYISSDVNPLFDEVLENIESKDSYDSNIDEPDLLVTPLSDANKNECFDSGGDDDEINVLDCEVSYYDSEGDILYLESFLNDDLVHYDPSILAMSVASILEGFTDEPPLEENDDLFDLESKNDDWKKILYDAQIDDLMSEDKKFYPGIHD
uniref:Retrovirus-related Pol polyprotein from transposon TNT 1-94 n=1 Tax=Tanacetum cinerariifolium TaxID=118510 RepID=A0A6L2MGY8_TANCI|nr:hypothetical protein [Tanacetum cinerariifolium]